MSANEWDKMSKKRSHQPRDSSIAFVTFWLFKQTLNKLPKITDLFRGQTDICIELKHFVSQRERERKKMSRKNINNVAIQNEKRTLCHHPVIAHKIHH